MSVATRRVIPPRRMPGERAWVAALLAAHTGLLLWSVLANSVTFDENFHVPAGVALVTRGAFHTSAINPPLAKMLFGIAALASGARPPTDEAIRHGEQGVVGESFMRVNAAHYHRTFAAARGVVVACSVLLGVLVWRIARRTFGPAGGLLALGFYAFAPEALAHGSVATMDVPTALSWLACVYGFWMFARSGRWAWWWAAAGAFGAALLVRFSAPLIVPALMVILVHLARRGQLRRPRRAWVGLALLLPVAFGCLQIGYAGRTSFRPLRDWSFLSQRFQAVQQRFPALRPPLPDAFIDGMDQLAFESTPGRTPTFVNGRVHMRAFWWYLPYALVLKWPLGFMAAIAVRGAQSLWRGAGCGRVGGFVMVAPLLLLAVMMFYSQFDVGIRYVYVLVPALCVWLGGLATHRRVAHTRTRRRSSAPGWAVAGTCLALAGAVESVAAAPWHLTFFNLVVGGPGAGDRRINDSNVDWGQGLVALREEMRRLHITRLHLAYHGTTDPAVYGIDYVPYAGGTPGPESEWFAVSSYFRVGLGSRRMTHSGRTAYSVFDFSRLSEQDVVARPARCMYLFRLR